MCPPYPVTYAELRKSLEIVLFRIRCGMRKISVKFSVVLILDPGGIQKGPVKLGLSVLPFLCLSVFPSIRPDVFLNLDYYFFLNFGTVLETHMKLCVTEPDFLVNFLCSKNWEN